MTKMDELKRLKALRALREFQGGGNTQNNPTRTNIRQRVQPVYLGERDDISVMDCVVGQLKYKAGDEDPITEAEMQEAAASPSFKEVEVKVEGEITIHDYSAARALDL